MIAIDAAHSVLLFGLVRAQKPTSILELGYGEGVSARAIQAALSENRQPYAYHIVDNWIDWQGVRPDEAQIEGAVFVTAEEGDYIASCPLRFDFIFSDADHQRAEQWFARTYFDLLAPGGILCYHDVCNPDFANLAQIVRECEQLGLRYVVFRRNSRAKERCDRGLLVIFKPGETQA